MTDLPTLMDVAKEVLKGVEADSPFRKGFERAVEEFKMLIEAHTAAYQKEMTVIWKRFGGSKEYWELKRACDAVLALAGLTTKDLKGEK